MKKLAVAFLFAASHALAQPGAPAIPPRPILLRAARLFDGTTDTVISNGAVLVQGNRIVAAGANVAVPAGAKVIDGSGKTLLPGLIDSHMHLESTLLTPAELARMIVPHGTTAIISA